MYKFTEKSLQKIEVNIVTVKIIFLQPIYLYDYSMTGPLSIISIPKGYFSYPRNIQISICSTAAEALYAVSVICALSPVE